MIDIAGLHLFLFFLFTYKDNGFPAIFLHQANFITRFVG
jgi:hypothetical protein